MSEQSPINRIRQRIESYKKNDQWAKAAEECQTLITFFPMDAELHNQTGDAHQKANQGLTAIKFFFAAVQLFDKDKEYEKAIAVLKKILKIKPSAMDIKVKLAEFYEKAGRIAEAVESYQEAWDYFSELGSRAESLGIFKKLCELQPKNLIIHRKLADMYVEEKQPTKAAETYRSLLVKVKELGLNSEIENLVRTIVSLEPASVDERMELVQIYYSTARFEPAREEIQKILAVNPSFNRAYSLLGDILTELGEKDQAIKAYLRYLSERKSDIKVLHKTVKLQLETGQVRQALDAAALLVDRQMSQGDYKAARDLVELFRDLPREDIPTREFYVRLLALLEMKEDFTKEMQELIACLNKESKDDRARKLGYLLQGENSLKRVAEFLAGKPMVTDTSLDEDVIDDLTVLDGQMPRLNRPKPA